MLSDLALLVLWVVWFVSWIVAARWSDPAATRAGASASGTYRVLTIVGAALIILGSNRVPADGVPLWRLAEPAHWVFVAIVAVGLAFVWWARIHLGRLWSSSVTSKAGHRVVDSGPYGIVRHPIYTGLLAALYATALVSGSAIAIAGAVVMTFGFLAKARLEERFLREQLGPADYDAYRRRVPMLLPFGPTSA